MYLIDQQREPKILKVLCTIALCIEKLFDQAEQGWKLKINLHSEIDQERDPNTLKRFFFRSSSGLVSEHKYHFCILFLEYATLKQIFEYDFIEIVFQARGCDRNKKLICIQKSILTARTKTFKSILYKSRSASKNIFKAGVERMNIKN